MFGRSGCWNHLPFCTATLDDLQLVVVDLGAIDNFDGLEPVEAVAEHGDVGDVRGINGYNKNGDK